MDQNDAAEKISARIHIACRGVKEGDGWADDSA